MPNSTVASANPSDPSPTAGRRRWQRVRRILPWLAGGLPALAILLWLGVQTPPGREAVALLASRLASTATGMQVRIEALGGSLPTDFTIGRLAMADNTGVWLAVKDLHLAWSPLALLRGRVHIQALTADIVRIRRAPNRPPEPTPQPPMAWPPHIPSLPPMVVNTLAVNRLLLDAALAGQDAAIRVAGRLAESGQGALAVHLTATRLNGPPLHLTVAGSLHYAAWRLAIKSQLTDSPGGLLATALAGPSAGALDVRLTGDGSLDAWQGSLTASLGGQTFVETKLGLAVPLHAAAMASWSVSGAVSPPAGMLPEDAARLLGEHCQVHLAGRTGLTSGAFILDRATLQAAVGSLDATAALDPEKDTLTARAHVHVPAAEKLDPNLAGDIDAVVTASGRLARPTCQLAVTAQQLRAGTVGAETARWSATAVLPGDLDGLFPGAAITAEGNVTGLTGPDGTTLLGRDLRLRLTGSVTATGGLVLKEGVLSGPDGRMHFSGSRTPAGDLAGRLTAEHGPAERTDVRLAAEGTYAAAGGRLAAKITATSDDLAPLGETAGTRLAGTATLDATLSGTTQALDMAVNGRIRNLTAASVRLDTLDLTATAKPQGGQTVGRLRLAAGRDRETAGLECGFALAGETLRLSDLRLSAPETQLHGSLALDLGHETFAGNLAGASANLAGLGRFLGLPLGGTLKITATAESPSRTDQRLTAAVTAGNLSMAGLTIRELTLAARLDHLFDLPRGKADLTAKGLTVGGLDAASLTLSAAGDGRSLKTTASAHGSLASGQPWRLTVKTRLTASGQRRTLTIGTLSGSLAKRPFALASPASLTMDAGAFRLAPLTLSLDKARLTASGSLSPSKVAATAALTQFPLPLLALVGGHTGFQGTAGATAHLSGTPARPRLDVGVQLDGIKLIVEGGQSLPPMTVRATAALADGRLALTTSLAGTGKKALITAQAELPAHLSLVPWAFDLPPAGTVSGRLTGDGDLADLAGPLAQVNTRLVGRVQADLTLAGTLAAPALTGSLRLDGSRLENADTGLVLRDIVVRLAASDGTITIRQCTAKDLKNGHLAITGSLGPVTAGDLPVAIDAKLSHLKVAGLDMVTATADGAIALTGSLNHLTAKGALTLGPVDVTIPQSLPPDVVVIPVTEINNPQAASVPAPQPEAAKQQLDLDLRITLGGAVYVRGMGIESRWGGTVTITGPADAPLGQGRLFVERGKVELFGSDLDITKGEVLFDGQSLLAPRINIQASNTNDDITAGVSLTGDATSPSIALFSNPVLPDNEILARILFGQSASNLSPLQAVQLAQAAASLYTGGGPTSILSRTRRILGLDQLNIVTSNKDSTNPTAMLRAGKEIFKGVTVGVEQGMEAQSGAVSVEVKITPNITVDSRVGEDNTQGVGVNWKWDY